MGSSLHSADASLLSTFLLSFLGSGFFSVTDAAVESVPVCGLLSGFFSGSREA